MKIAHPKDMHKEQDIVIKGDSDKFKRFSQHRKNNQMFSQNITFLSRFIKKYSYVNINRSMRGKRV